jgi:hypothetical protein
MPLRYYSQCYPIKGGKPKGESMIANQKSFEVGASRVLPGDLRQSFDSQTLVGFVLQAQADMDSKKLNMLLPERTIASGQANALLAVLTYCYACDMTSSQELEQNAETDPMIRYLCSNRLPSVSTLKRFRRHNREQIEACLVNVFKLVWQARLERMFLPPCSSRFTPFHDSPCRVDSSENRAESGLLSYFEGEAGNRLLNAIQCDSMEMDV